MRLLGGVAAVLAAALLLYEVLPRIGDDGDDPPPSSAVPDAKAEVGLTGFGLPLEAPPRLVRRFDRFPAEDVVVQGNRVWVLGDNQLSRIDARTGRVTGDLAHFPVAEMWGLELAGGALWVLATDDPPDQGTAVLFRVDPRTLRRRRIPLGDVGIPLDPSLAAAGDAIFVALVREGGLLRVDARSGERTAIELPEPAGDPLALAAGPGELWVAAQNYEPTSDRDSQLLFHLDPRTGAVRGEPVRGECFDLLAVAAETAWAYEECRDRLVRLRPGVEHDDVLDVPRLFTPVRLEAGLGRVWLHHHGELFAIGPGEQLVSLDLPTGTLGGMDVAGGALWVATGGAVVRVAPGERGTHAPGRPPRSIRPGREPLARDEAALWPETVAADARAECDAVRDARRNLYRRDPVETALQFMRVEIDWFGAIAAGVRPQGTRTVVTIARSERAGAPRVEVTSAPVPGAPACRWVTGVAPVGGGYAVRASISDSGDEFGYERTVELRAERGRAVLVDGKVGFGGLVPQGVASDQPGVPLRTTIELDDEDFPLRGGGSGVHRDLTGHYLMRFIDRSGRAVAARGDVLSP